VSVVANVAINVDSRGATQQLRAVQQGAQATSQAVDKLNATTAASSDKFKIAANGIKYFTDATGRARAENGKLLSSSERAAAGLQAQGRAAQQASGKFNGLRNAIASLGAGLALRKSFVDASELESAQSRIGLLVKNFGQLSGIQNVAADAAKKFNLSQSESLNALTDLGNRIGPTGASLKDISTVYDGFNTLLALNKVNSQQAASATLQLNQALGSGRLAGEEFNAISEATPQLLDAVAVVMGKNRSELKKLAADGQISSAVLIKALKKIKDEGAKDLETAFGGAFGATRKFDAAIKNFSATIGTELLPVLTPLINKVTEILKQFGSLPGPVKTAAAAILGATAAFVVLAPAISAAIGLLGGLKLAAIGAIGAVSTLSGALLALAGIGIVTVGVNYVITQVGDIIGSSTAAGKSVAAASKGGLQAQLKGKSAEDRRKMLATARKNLDNDKKLATQLRLQIQMEENAALSANEGPLPSQKSKLTEIQARINTNQARIKAIRTLPITQATPPKPQLPPPTGAIPPADGGGGAGKEPKEKKIKAAKEILDITSEEAKLQSQLILYTAQEDKYAQALLTKELAIYEAKNSQLGPNTKKVAMFKAEIDYTKTINDLEKEKADRFKSQVDVFASQTSQINNQSEAFKLRNRLQMEGVKPELIEGELKLLETRQLLNAEITKLEESLAAGTINQEDYAKTINAVKLAAEGTAIAIQTYTAATAAASSPIQQFIGSAQTQLKDLESVAVRVSQGIGDAVGNSLTKGIQGLVEGTTTAQQVFADFLKSIGDILMQEGTKMIATYTAIAIARALAGMFGGGGAAPAAAPSGTLPQTDMFKYVNLDGLRAAGGPVSSNSTYMVGEKGPELFVPSTAGTIIPAGPTAGIREAMANGNGQSNASPVLNMSFESSTINGVEYVSRDQLEAAMMETRRQASRDGAKRGMTMTLDRLQQSPSTRSRIGLG